MVTKAEKRRLAAEAAVATGTPNTDSDEWDVPTSPDDETTPIYGTATAATEEVVDDVSEQDMPEAPEPIMPQAKEETPEVKEIPKAQSIVHATIATYLSQYEDDMATPAMARTDKVVRTAAVKLKHAITTALRDDGDDTTIKLLEDFFKKHIDGLMSERLGLRGTETLNPKDKNIVDAVHYSMRLIITNPRERKFSVENLRKMVDSGKFITYIARHMPK